MKVKYLHTMVRVKDLDASMRFYELLGLKEVRRIDNDKGRFTLVFMAPEGQEDAPGRADAQLGRRRGAAVGQPALRASRLRGRGHLRQVRGTAGGGGDDQPAAARRAHGVRALAGQRVGGAVADRRAAAAAGAVGEHGEQRHLVRAGAPSRGAGRGRAGGGGLPAGAVARARRVVVGRRARVPAADGGAGGGAGGARGAGGVPGVAGAAGDAARLRVVGLAAAAGDRLPWTAIEGPERPRRGWRGCSPGSGGASSSIRRRSATRCSSAGGRSPTRGDCERRTLDVSGDGTNNDGIAPELARRDAALAGVTVNGLVIGANVATLGRYYQQFVIQGPGAFVESAEDYDGFERAMRRKLLRELGVIEMSDGPVNRTGRSRAINARFAARWRGARAGRRSMPGEAQRVRRGGGRLAWAGRHRRGGARRAADRPGPGAGAGAGAGPRRRGRRRPTWRRSPAGWRPSSARRRRRSCRGSPSWRRTSCIGGATARRRPRRRRRSTLVALYDDATRTIYLAEGWTGDDAAGTLGAGARDGAPRAEPRRASLRLRAPSARPRPTRCRTAGWRVPARRWRRRSRSTR